MTGLIYPHTVQEKMTLHIFFTLAKNVEIILQERERQVCNGGQRETDTDTTFPVIREPISETWKKAKGLKESDAELEIFGEG